MLQNIETLYAIQRHCAEDRPLPANHRKWLAESIGRYLEHCCDNLNEAFGVVQDHGGVPWWREQAIRLRDDALRGLSREHFEGLSVYARAKAIAEISSRYSTTCWPRDKLLDEMPARYIGSPKEYLWQAFRSNAKMPVCERHLRNLLRDQ